METTLDDQATRPTTEPGCFTPRVENSTDATRGQPLAMRAAKRKIELQAAVDKLSAEEPARMDIERAVATIDALLMGDSAHLAPTTSAELNRVLESAKHLAETAPVSAAAVATEQA
jgi:hypothetical protein